MKPLIIDRIGLDAYLKCSDIIDYDHPAIEKTAVDLTKSCCDEADKVESIFEFVRDEIPHSFDIQSEIVTCKASDVLLHREGICYAKAHLLAALLRCLGIPSGFCYQKLLFSAERPQLSTHGLNAVYLSDLNRWIRLDARGNKPGVDAQFFVDQEKLAFTVRPELGESDGLTVYAEPSPRAVAALQTYQNTEDLLNHLPDEI